MNNKRSSKKQPVKVSVVLDISQQLKEMEAEFNNAFLLTDKGVLVLRQPGPFHEGTKPVVERKFKTADEMQELILNNKQILFGENAVLLNEKKEISLAGMDACRFDSIIIDFRDVLKPRLYFLLALHYKQYFNDFFYRVTDFFACLRDAEALNNFQAALCDGIEKNPLLKKQLKEKIGEETVAELVSMLVKFKPNVLLVTDGQRPEVTAVIKTYTETWGAMVKPIEVKKYASNGDILVTVKPDFASLQNGKKLKADVVPKTTEGAHLESVSASVKEVYEKIKAELLKQDKTLLFNVKQYYISMKKTRNLAFFHLRKKNLYLVVMCEEKEVRKTVKHHVIKTLPPSVQKFWNGASTGIVIEQPTHLEEIINLLKKMIGNGKINGNEPASHEENGKKKEIKPSSKVKTKAPQKKAEKKAKTKKK